MPFVMLQAIHYIAKHPCHHIVENVTTTHPDLTFYQYDVGVIFDEILTPLCSQLLSS